MRPIILFLCITFSLFADIQTYERSHTYKATKLDTEITARSKALEHVKILLLEEVGKFIQSKEKLTYTNGKEVYEEEVTTFTAGITETKILKSRWKRGKYKITAAITVDTDKLLEQLKKLLEKEEVLEELKEERHRTDSLLATLDSLQKALEEASEQEVAQLEETYLSESQKIASLELYNQAKATVSIKQKKQIYAQALEMDSTNYLVYYRLGETDERIGDEESAIKNLNKAIALKPTYQRSVHKRGEIYFRQKKYNKALKDFTTLLVKRPKNAKAHYSRAKTYLMLKEYDKALSALNKTLQLKPTKIKALTNRAILLSKQGKHEQALKDYTKAVSLGANDASLHIHAGNSFSRAGQNKKALKAYSKAVKKNPNNVKAYQKRAKIYTKNKEYNKALKDYNRAIELQKNKKSAHLYERRAALYVKMNKPQKAISDYNRYLQHDTNPQNQKKRAQITAKIKKMGGVPKGKKQKAQAVKKKKAAQKAKRKAVHRKN